MSHSAAPGHFHLTRSSSHGHFATPIPMVWGYPPRDPPCPHKIWAIRQRTTSIESNLRNCHLGHTESNTLPSSFVMTGMYHLQNFHQSPQPLTVPVTIGHPQVPSSSSLPSLTHTNSRVSHMSHWSRALWQQKSPLKCGRELEILLRRQPKWFLSRPSQLRQCQLQEAWPATCRS